MRNEERAALRAGATEEVEETASVLELPETEEKEFKFKSIFTNGENGIKKFGIRNIVIVLSVLLIGAAVFVNWTIFGGNKGGDDATNGGDSALVGGNTDNGGANGNTNETVDFFAASQIERQRARDEAIEVLQNVVDDATSLDAAKEQALAEIAAIAANIETEANIESLIKAKGFEECVAVISGDKANIVVKSEGLRPNQLSQILEIVYLQANILPANVTISEK
ncbi:MAG: SpoIIIAH-like family protein [Ruminococcaceae bacterium]|nr:SpoIIIAH-like family protein [Oscillospiraceae bacterium]